MEMLGIDRAEAFIAVKPGQEHAVLSTYGEFFNQNFEANRAGFSYAVSGAPIGDVTEWLTNGRGQFSSIRMWTDGQQFQFAPAYTLPSVVLGFSTTLSGNVSTIMNSTRGLNPQYQHLFSGDPNDPNAG